MATVEVASSVVPSDGVAGGFSKIGDSLTQRTGTRIPRWIACISKPNRGGVLRGELEGCLTTWRIDGWLSTKHTKEPGPGTYAGDPCEHPYEEGERLTY